MLHSLTSPRLNLIAIITVAVVATLLSSASIAQAADGSATKSNFWSALWWFTPKQTTSQPTDEPSPIAQTSNSMHFLPSLRKSFVEPAKADSGKIVAGWLTPWGDDSYNSFKNNLNTITEVHPFVYTIGTDGVTAVPDQGDWHQAEITRLSKQHDIKIIPTISGDVNSSDLMLNDPAKQKAHIQELVQLVETNEYDGIDIDYEGFMNGYNRDVYATFITDLSKAMHARGKLVGIAVEAFNTQQNWEAFGAAVDRFEIMGYDFHSATTDEVGPIGPADWLKTVIDTAATRVPREKIILGLGTYGYSWAWNGTKYSSTAVNYDDAIGIAKETGATIQRNDDAPYFSYNRGSGDKTLYFEDATSTAPKLAVAKQENIGGIAFWRFGSEDPAIWKGVTDYVKN